MSRSYIGMRETASRTTTALSRFSARMTGWYDDSCRASRSVSSLVTESSLELLPWSLPMISSSSRATPRIVIVDSGLFALKLTSSAHVYLSGNIRASTSLKVRFSRSRSAFPIISATSAT